MCVVCMRGVCCVFSAVCGCRCVVADRTRRTWIKGIHRRYAGARVKSHTIRFSMCVMLDAKIGWKNHWLCACNEHNNAYSWSQYSSVSARTDLVADTDVPSHGSASRHRTCPVGWTHIQGTTLPPLRNVNSFVTKMLRVLLEHRECNWFWFHNTDCICMRGSNYFN